MKNYDVELTELVGSKIVSLKGYIGTEYGPAFKPSSIEFENGVKCHFEGEHDYPYLTLEFHQMLREKLAEILSEEPDLLQEVLDELPPTNQPKPCEDL